MVCASALALLIGGPIAAAQQPPKLRVRGTIEKVDGRLLTVKGRHGATLAVKLADGAPVRTVVKRSLADVKVGSFVGITAMPEPDGSQRAVEIHIFPEAMRGTGEGHRPWDLMPNSSMTNADVDSVVVGANARQLVLKYKGGEQKFTVPADVTVVLFAPGTVADLKPGAKIFIVAAKKLPNGTLEAPAITVGTNGVDPPM